VQVAAEQQASSVSVADVPVPSVTPVTESTQDVAMDVDTAQSPHNGGAGKRKAEEDVEPEGHKKVRIGKHPIQSLCAVCKEANRGEPRST
jgi:squamous cell carcinoma antigen recognized by T-cells 3